MSHVIKLFKEFAKIKDLNKIVLIDAAREIERLETDFEKIKLLLHETAEALKLAEHESEGLWRKGTHEKVLQAIKNVTGE